MTDNIRRRTTSFFVYHDQDLSRVVDSLFDTRERYSFVDRCDVIVSVGFLGLVDSDEGVLFRPRDKVDEPMMLYAAHLNNGNNVPTAIIAYDGHRCFSTKVERMSSYDVGFTGKEETSLVLSTELKITDNDRELLEAASAFIEEQ
jgi:hypothetical protein